MPAPTARDLRRNAFRIIEIICAIALVVTSASATEGPVPGDAAFTAMQYETARDAYEAALQQNPHQANILWRMARLYLCLGDIAEGEKQQAHYQRAVEYARRSIMADSTLSEGHTWLAAALGSMAMEGSSRQKVSLARDIKRELDVAISLNPDNDAARSILGSFYRALGNISWVERTLANLLLGGIPSGGFEEAERELQLAVKLAPEEFRHHYELGRLYLDWDREEDALASFTRAIGVGPGMAADRARIERAKNLIAELRGS